MTTPRKLPPPPDTGPVVTFPDKRDNHREHAPGVGVQGIHRNDRTDAPVARAVTAVTAGEASELFGKGGEAFAIWARAQGVPAGERRTAEGWSELLQAFAARPIHGHRRGSTGGDHRPNRRHLR